MAFTEINHQNYIDTPLGALPDNWDVCSLGDLSTIKGGKRLPKGYSLSETPTTHPYIRITDIDNNKLNCEDINYIEDDVYEKIKHYTVDKDDVCVTIVGTTGITFTIPDVLDGANLTENAVKFTALKKITRKYLFYYLQSSVGKHQMGINTVGAVQPKLPIYGLENVLIPVPPIAEQELISNFLYDLDKKIELNNQILRTLENLSMGIFKRWFIDFEFPDANGKPYKSTNGVMMETDIGLIPAKFQLTKIGHLSHIDRGLSYKGSYLANAGNPLVNLGMFSSSEIVSQNSLKHYTGTYRPQHVVSNGDIVIANTDLTQNRTVLGKACIIGTFNTSVPVLFTHHVYALRLNNPIYRSFLFQTLKTPKFKSQAIQFATGTTVLFLPQEAISEYQIALPDPDLLNKFNEVFDLLLLYRMELNTMNERLSDLKNHVLTRLIVGKLRFK